HPDDPSFIIEGNDGGLNISHDRGENWRFIENIPLAQFYHISHDMDIPYNVAGGMQDNGSWVGPSSIWKSGGIRNYDWQEVYFGDGFDVVFKPDDNRYVYAMSQGGNVGMVDRETGKSKFIRPVHPEGISLRFNWNAAIAQDPFAPCGLYFGSQFVHYSTDCGSSWKIISPDLTTDDPEKQKQAESGGLTIDDTRAENHTTILAIAPSPVDRQVIWVGTDDGNLQLTRDGGQSWTNLADRLPDVKPGSWIPYIELSRTNPGEAFIVVNDYRRNDWRPMAFHTADFGQTFTRIVDETKVEGFVLSIVQDPEVPELLWLGTDYGLYFTIDGGENWNKWTHGFPSVQVSDLKIHPRDHDLIVGTFGRAAWILDDIRPLREIARSGGEILQDSFVVFDPPDAYLAEFRSYEGIRFGADATFDGDNRWPLAMISVWVKPGKEEEQNQEEEEDGKDAKKKRPEKVKVNVIDMAGDTIRTFTSKVDTAMNRIFWNLRHDGVDFPSRRDPRPDADVPSGYEALPGTYKLVVTYGDHKDSTMVTVHADPRLNIDEADLRARQAVYDEFYQIVEKANDGLDRIKSARKTIDRVGKAISLAPDSLRKEIGKMEKSLKDSLDKLEELYFQPEDFKGIRRSDEKLPSYLFAVMRYLGSMEGTPNQAVDLTIQKAREETAKALNQINAFFEKDFAEYRGKVEEIEFELFEAYEPVKIE
ncbi:MAG: hypothetical protein R3350_04370, partial [Saprospiraceae bacterium]|nr:hypothetical protein [Saprospiraceae bacterium]